MRALWSAAGDQVAEDVERQAFQLAREVVVAPCVAHQALRAGAIALQQERAGERELALGGGGPVLAEERAHERRIAPVRPQRRLGAATQHADRRPGRVLVDEGHVAAEIDAVGVVAAQDRPFDQLAGDRIADGLRQVGGLCRLAPARGGDRLIEGGDIGRGNRLAAGDREPRRRAVPSRSRQSWSAWRRLSRACCRAVASAAARRRRNRPAARQGGPRLPARSIAVWASA